ncbi:MAG: metallophosphoesterase [Lachnospiraceae bacterium]|jgi:Icc-related predicted phosphoesterase|nr:metallophosphoesterase [Lachnospiraceae bacterium]
MKILALSDVESKALWDFFRPEYLEGIDVIVSCGDLDPRYLSFLATFFHGPVLYVHGNHDDLYEKIPPEGCICIEDKIYEYQGIRFLGLGGSMRYRQGAWQFTQKQMNRRVRKLWLGLRFHHGFDVLVTHAPAWHINDHDNLVHTGFQAFRHLIEKYEPKLMLHGHVHLNYGMKAERIRSLGDTTIINAFEKYVAEVPETPEQTDISVK